MTAVPREVEAALLVCGEDPAGVVTSLAALTEIAGYGLQALDPQNLHDLYFDTPDERLGRAAIALRLRSVDGSWHIALKGPSTQVDPGTVDRSELELPWSIEAFHQVVGSEPALDGVPEKPALETEHGDPVLSMQRRGLVVVQDRETRRQRRAVVLPGPARQPVAELAIDAVTFTLSRIRARLYEVEVELKKPDAAAAVREVVQALQHRYSTELRPWPYGKLMTGKTLEALARTGELSGLLGSDRLLRATGCARVEDWLKSARPGD